MLHSFRRVCMQTLLPCMYVNQCVRLDLSQFPLMPSRYEIQQALHVCITPVGSVNSVGLLVASLLLAANIQQTRT
jgi:hypothetical protein